jgi:DNA-binding FadR family transcriptional regulator
MTPPARSLASPVPPPTAADSVFETLLADIVRGVYPPRSRLPAERELARILGSSRPTIREALSRLAEWNLVEARRGSGVVVRDQREWNIEVLPAYLRFAGAAIEPKTLARMVRDLLTLRRQMIVECLRLVSDRIANTRLQAARDAVKHAWDSRHDGVTFAAEDFRVMRAIIEAADFLPGVWLLNRLAGVYLDVAHALTGAIAPPSDYVLAHDRLLDALEDGDGAQAVQIIDTYLESHDQRLLAKLGATP